MAEAGALGGEGVLDPAAQVGARAQAQDGAAFLGGVPACQDHADRTVSIMSATLPGSASGVMP